MATAVLELPEHLRFGVPTRPGRVLAASGVRHRRAFVELGLDPAIRDLPAAAATAILEESRTLLANTVAWEPKLGRLVMENTLQDLDAALR